MAIFLIWIATAELLYQSLFGFTAPESISQFVHDVLTTSRGWTLIVVGNVLGFLFAVLVLIISIVSFPLLLDREVGAAGPVPTSLRAVRSHPRVLASFGPPVARRPSLGS